MKPLIGITPSFNSGTGVISLQKNYGEAIAASGGIPVSFLLSEDPGILLEAFKRCDGILLSGGIDIDPGSYKEARISACGGSATRRDDMEIFIVRRALKKNLPILGICRGMQLMNIAAGGTLYQDIYTQISDRPILRHTRTAANLHPRHEIEIVRNSIIHNSFHTDRVWVNSYHHQAVKTLAPGFRVTSRASDGIIESIEHSDRKFAVGIQWHPERLWAIESIYQNIFIEFIRCCENAQ